MQISDMPKLPVISGKDVITILHKIGFQHTRTAGSHAILKRDGKVVPVPLHKELAKGTLKSIMNQAGLTTEELIDLNK